MHENYGNTVHSPVPSGVRLWPLTTHQDARGSLTEMFRDEWPTGVKPVQWNVVYSDKQVLRGVHVHIKHDDYLILLQGRAYIGLRDLRPGSPTEGLASLIELTPHSSTALTIPHGFYFQEPSWHVYAVTEYWHLADEWGCHWADPALEIPWPFHSDPILSARDAQLPRLNEIAGVIPPFMPPCEGEAC